MKGKIQLGLVFGILGLLIFGLTFKRCAGEREPKAIQAKLGAPLMVDAIIAKTTTLQQSIETTGELLAFQEVWLSSERNAKLVEWKVRDGESVQKGQWLATLFHDDLLAKMKGLEARIQEARSKANRFGSLQSNQNVTVQEYESALAQLKSLEADSQLLAVEITQSLVRAPFQGQVGMLDVSPGSYATLGSKLVYLVQSNPLKLDVFVPEKYASRMEPNQTITLKLKSPDTLLKTSIKAISPSLDPSSRNLRVRAWLDNPQGHLKPGGFGTVDIELKDIPNAVVVPSKALIPEIRGYRVVVSDKGLARNQEVVPGIRTDSSVHIVYGLKPGDTVLTSGILQARPGTRLEFKTLSSQP